MSKKKQNWGALTNTGISVPGLEYNPADNSFSFSALEVPACEQVFYCTDYKVALDDGELHFVFGNKSKISTSAALQLAIEIAFPLKRAVDIFYKGVWESKSLNGVTTFAESLQQTVKDQNGPLAVRAASSSFTLPTDPSCYRMFGANFASLTIADGQAMLEFFICPPDLINNLIHKHTVRPGDGIKSVVAVITTPKILLSIVTELRSSLKTQAGNK